MSACQQCGTAVVEAVRFRDVCPACGAYLHTCSNCRLYRPSAPNHCLSRTTEFVRDVAAANFCEEFELAPAAAAEQSDTAKSRFDQLFGD
jgi:hypothetical protein